VNGGKGERNGKGGGGGGDETWTPNRVVVPARKIAASILIRWKRASRVLSLSILNSGGCGHASGAPLLEKTSPGVVAAGD